MCLGLTESVWQTVGHWGKKILYVILSRIKKLTLNSPAMSRSQYPKEKINHRNVWQSQVGVREQESCNIKQAQA